MANSGCSGTIDEIRASILAHVIRRDYLEQMLENARILEAAHGSNCPHALSWELQDLKEEETRKNKSLEAQV